MKKISILTFLFFAIGLTSNGQESKFSIGLIGSIESNDYDFKEMDINSNYEYESFIGYSFGSGMKYGINEKLFIESGLTYYSQGYQVKYNYIFADQGDPAIPKHSDLTVSYLKVPLKVGYEVFKIGNVKFNPTIGLNTAFQLYSMENTTYEDNSEKESDYLSNDLNEIQLSLNLDLGFEFNFSEKIALSITPFISKGLNKLDKNTMDTGQLSYGGLFGIYYKL